VKGQASAEYILLFAVSLVIVMIVIGALNGLSDTVGKYNDRQRMLLASDALFSAARDACYIGDGTSFSVELITGVNITDVSMGNMPCEIEKGSYSGTVLVENVGNKIKVS
jgi:hypothetical protein